MIASIDEVVMEMFFTDHIGTTIAGFQQHTIDRSRCVHCSDLEYGDQLDCTCPDDSMAHYVMILVKVIGYPIMDRPSDATYDIQIWECDDVESSCTPDRFYESSPVIQMILGPSADSSDLEHTYRVPLLRYYDAIMGITQMGYDFKGVVSRSSYVKAFHVRVESLLSGREREDQSECAHISRRKKGHSHAKK